MWSNSQKTPSYFTPGKQSRRILAGVSHVSQTPILPSHISATQSMSDLSDLSGNLWNTASSTASRNFRGNGIKGRQGYGQRQAKAAILIGMKLKARQNKKKRNMRQIPYVSPLHY